jgi:hypothetical protein
MNINRDETRNTLTEKRLRLQAEMLTAEAEIAEIDKGLALMESLPDEALPYLRTVPGLDNENEIKVTQRTPRPAGQLQARILSLLAGKGTQRISDIIAALDHGSTQSVRTAVFNMKKKGVIQVGEDGSYRMTVQTPDATTSIGGETPLATAQASA